MKTAVMPKGAIGKRNYLDIYLHLSLKHMHTTSRILIKK